MRMVCHTVQSEYRVLGKLYVDFIAINGLNELKLLHMPRSSLYGYAFQINII